MRRCLGKLCALVLAGCGSGAFHQTNQADESAASASSTLEITGTVQWYTTDGGFWAIVTGGDAYRPRSGLAVEWQKVNLPVRAVLRVPWAAEAAHPSLPLPPVEILELEQLACADLPCPGLPPAVGMVIAAAAPSGHNSVYEAILANVVRPAGSSGPDSDCVTRSDTPTSPVIRRCWINGFVSGVYEADVKATGFETKHVRFEVPARNVQPYECCAVHYVPQGSWVFLSPSP
jgi:hypothetical protein